MEEIGITHNVNMKFQLYTNNDEYTLYKSIRKNLADLKQQSI